MIVATDRGDWLLVTQNDHAALAADLLGSWRALAGISQRELLLRATRRHDNGWRETDSAPRIDAEGNPQDFRSVPSRERRRLWERGIERYRRSDPECALLVVEHALWLHRDAAADRDLLALTDTARQVREELTGEDPGRLALVTELYPWLRLADDLSLRSCMGLTAPFELELPGAHRSLTGTLRRPEAPSEVSIHSTMWKLSVDPFPLAGATTFRIRYRRILRRVYRDDAELAVALACGRWTELGLRVEPAGHGTR
ncbi:MAG TPA: DUF3891 family protein [Thermoanaerobaculia bacterium]|nr:DUF3891 family protein [Thermoanaerobaculia bacterium]